MKTILLLIKVSFLYLLALQNVSAQIPIHEWGGKIEGSIADSFGYNVKSSKTDALGNTYMTGYFKGTADFDIGSGVTNLTSVGAKDIFIIKMDPLGNLLWAKGIGGIGNDSGNDIHLDATGNVYVTGNFIVTVDFDPGPGVANLDANDGNDNIFALKLNNSGDFIWASNIAGNQDAHITTDASNNVYVSGQFYLTEDFDPGPGTFNLTAAGGRDVFIKKLDASGNFVWVKSIGGTSYDDAYGIVSDAAGNTYITGRFNLTADFDPGAGVTNLTSNGNTDVFVLKLDAVGNFVWAKSMGGLNYDESTAIDMDASGNVYVTGYFVDVADFDPGPGTFNLTSAGARDIFIEKLDDLGNMLWAKSIGGPGTDNGNDIAVNDIGEVHLTGWFDGTSDFDPGPAIFNLSSQVFNHTLFVEKLDASGDFQWATAITGNAHIEGYAVSSDGAGNVYASGNLFGTIDMDPGPGENIINVPSGKAIFITKISECFPTAPAPDVPVLADVVSGGQCSLVVVPTAPTATNNCGYSFTGTPDLTFPINTQGTTVLTWTFDDGDGNTSTQTQNLIINDITAPFTLTNLSSISGECAIDLPVAPTAMDNCEGSISGVPDLTFPLTTLGLNIITWTYDDGNGNTSSQQQWAFVGADQTAPVADVLALADLTGVCSVSTPTSPTATDHCSGSITGTTNATFPINSSGIITWAYDDGNGNTSTQTQNVIITDAVVPVADMVSLVDLTNECSLAMPTLPTATDNCAGTVVGIPDKVFPITMSDVITWTYDDGNGNITTQTQNVIINDATSPVADVASLTDLAGLCSLNASAPTASDNCAGTVVGVPDVTFPITALGATLVTWTYDDGNGNTSIQTQNVTVQPSPITGVQIQALSALPACEGSTVSFKVTITGGNPSYQWQEDTGSGFVSITDGAVYSGTNTPVLVFDGLTAFMNGYFYRCLLVEDYCQSISNQKQLTVSSASNNYVTPNIQVQCEQTNFSVPLQGSPILTDVLGLDFCMEYDEVIITPTGTATIGEVVNQGSPNYADYYLNISTPGIIYGVIYYTAQAPFPTFLNGNGLIIDIHYTLNPGIPFGTTTEIKLCGVTEGTLSSGSVEVCSGLTSTVEIVSNPEFTGTVEYWNKAAKPLIYDLDIPAANLETQILGTDNLCNLTSYSVLTDTLGNFNFNTDSATYLTISRDIPGNYGSAVNCTNVMALINGTDQNRALKIATNDASFIPTVYQILAADVNLDGSVSSVDVTLMSARSVMSICGFPNNGVLNSLDWVFIAKSSVDTLASYQISTLYPLDDGQGYSKSSLPVIPDCFEIPITIGPLCVETGTEAYAAILLGDVSGNWKTTDGITAREEEVQEVVINMYDVVDNNGTMTIPIYYNTDELINSLDFYFKTAEGIGIIDIQNNDSPVYNGLQVNWNLFEETELLLSSYSLANLPQSGKIFNLVLNDAVTVENAEQWIREGKAFINGHEVDFRLQLQDEVTGAENEVSHLMIYPNPADKVVYVDLFGIDPSDIQILSLNGAVVKHYGRHRGNSIELSLYGIRSGVYILRIVNELNIYQRKIIIK
jgi:hypothetical protein